MKDMRDFFQGYVPIVFNKPFITIPFNSCFHGMILEKVYNRGQNLLINAKKLSKSKQEYKLLISVFAHFLNAIAKFYF